MYPNKLATGATLSVTASNLVFRSCTAVDDTSRNSETMFRVEIFGIMSFRTSDTRDRRGDLLQNDYHTWLALRGNIVFMRLKIR